MKVDPERFRNYARTMRYGSPNEDRRLSPILAGEVADALDGAAAALEEAELRSDRLVRRALDVLQRVPLEHDPVCADDVAAIVEDGEQSEVADVWCRCHVGYVRALVAELVDDRYRGGRGA